MIIKTALNPRDHIVGFALVPGKPLAIGHHPEGFVVWSDTGTHPPSTAIEHVVELRATGTDAPDGYRHVGTATSDSGYVCHAFTRNTVIDQ